MNDDKYVPEHEMVRECWIDWSAGCGIGRKTAYEEFERYTSEIKAKALREAAGEFVGSGEVRDELESYLHRVADRIEEEA